MKLHNIITFILCVFAFSNTGNAIYAQTKNNKVQKTDIPFEEVQEKPTFVECKNITKDSQLKCFQEILSKYMKQNFEYPKKALERRIPGKVLVLFRIKTDGMVEVISATGPDELLEEGAKRIVEKLPQFIPGKQNGKPVSVIFKYPIDFRIQQDNEAPKEEMPFTTVQQRPRFQECKDVPESETFKCFKEQIDKHVAKNFVYPPICKELYIQGRVFVSFRIKTDGSIEIIGVRGTDKILEQAAKELIESLPKLIPGKQDGNPINVTFAYPINYSLEQ
ncbi:hypothetical protein RCZ04_20480 [Capnocytophaga sp. HP1101]